MLLELVLGHIRHAEASLANFHRDGTNTDGVLRNPRIQAAALKVAFEELRKAISVTDRTKW
jgi:hypothetical protein